MIFYAIKNKRTGALLPAPIGRGGRGGTRVNFGERGMPRIFDSKTAAKNALHWWLRGEVHVSISEDLDEQWFVKPRADRRPEDVEIVCIQLQEVEE
jgi:hypothetical protein